MTLLCKKNLSLSSSPQTPDSREMLKFLMVSHLMENVHNGDAVIKGQILYLRSCKFSVPFIINADDAMRVCVCV